MDYYGRTLCATDLGGAERTTALRRMSAIEANFASAWKQTSQLTMLKVVVAPGVDVRPTLDERLNAAFSAPSFGPVFR